MSHDSARALDHLIASMEHLEARIGVPVLIAMYFITREIRLSLSSKVHIALIEDVKAPAR